MKISKKFEPLLVGLFASIIIGLLSFLSFETSTGFWLIFSFGSTTLIVLVFFGFHLIGLALINLIIILLFILFLMKEYLIRDKISFYLMIPYLAWSGYALILNSSIFLLN